MINVERATVTCNNGNSKKIIITASIKDAKIYDNVFISEITINTQETYHINLPIYHSSFQPSHKKIDISLDPKDIGVNLSKDLLFVNIKTSGTPDISTPCGEDISEVQIVVFDKELICKKLLCLASNLGPCSLPIAYLDIYILSKYLKTKIVSNTSEIIKSWKRIIGESSSCRNNINTCNGRV